MFVGVANGGDNFIPFKRERLGQDHLNRRTYV
jgi:hypothetical protein